jgi:putative FmdB family regulatory protein
MPLYEYECPKCGARFEELRNATQNDVAECPECGAPAERQVSGFAVRVEGGTGSGKRCFTGG